MFLALWKAGFVCRVTFCRKKKSDSCHLRKSRGRKFKQPAELFQIDGDRKDKKHAWRLGWGTPARLSYPLKITFIGLLNLYSSFLRTSLSSFSSNINVSSGKRPESNSISAILLLTFVLRLRASISERYFMQSLRKYKTKYKIQD